MKFLRERLPFLQVLGRHLREPVGADNGWSRTLGSVLVFLFLLQIVSGLALALVYVSSTESAFENLLFYSEQYPSIRLTRLLHRWTTSFLVVVAVLHLLRIVRHRAYQRPKELNWLTGLTLLLLLLGFAVTGFLLPWDQKGYWSTVVGADLVKTIPLVGDGLSRILIGAGEVGQETLSRFFALHVSVFPLLLMVLVGLHLYLVRVHEAGGLQKGSRLEPFYPHQVLRDSLACLVCLVALIFCIVVFPGGSELKASPAGASFDARPEWFLLAHFELLRLVPGPAVVPGIVVPGLVFLFLLAVPFLDRAPGRMSRAVVVVGIGLLTASWLAGAAYSYFYNPPHWGEEVQVTADQLPVSGQPAVSSDRARTLLVDEFCMNCHRLGEVGGRVGPDLSAVGSHLSREEILGQLLDPRARNSATQMPSYRTLSEQDLDTLVDYLASMRQEGAGVR